MEQVYIKDKEGNRVLPITSESAVRDSNGNPLSSKLGVINDALDNRYTKSETYSKSQLDNLITTPNQKYVTVEADDQTTDVADVLPATGEKDTIYRVGNWDGSAYDITCYSEYAWDGTAYKFLSKKSQIGEVYDISAANGNETYDDLNDALTSNTGGVPSSLRKGGMSVKFILTSDNRYVQYRYMLTDVSTAATFTNVSNWQGVDEYVFQGGKNLIDSDGIYNFIESGNGIQINLNLLESKNRYIDQSLVWKSVQDGSVRCRIYTVSQSGIYTIYAKNGTAAVAVLTSDNTTLDTNAQLSPNYPNIIIAPQGETYELYVNVGEYIYIRDDDSLAGRPLPELYMDVPKEIDLSSLKSKNRYIDPSLVWKSTYDGLVRCKLYPVSKKGIYTIYAKNGLSNFAVLTSDDTTINTNAQLSPNYQDRITISKGETYELQVNVGEYIYVRDDVNPLGSVLPKVYLGEINPCIRRDEIEDAIIAESKKIPTSSAVYNYIENNLSDVKLDLSNIDKQYCYINSQTGKWAAVGAVYCRLYPVSQSGIYSVYAKNGVALVAVLTSDDTTIGIDVSFSENYPEQILIQQGDSYTLNVTEGQFIYMRDDDSLAGRPLPELYMKKDDSLIRKSTFVNLNKKKINCLFIGNSVNQDHVAYLPWLLKKAYGDEIDFRICIAYKASYTIKGYVEDIITGNVNLDIFSIAENVSYWENFNNYRFSDIWSNYGSFDLISFEGYFNHASSDTGMVEDTSYFAPFVEYLKQVNVNPFKLGYLLHQTYTNSGHTESEAWERIVNGAIYAIQHNPVSIVFPCGVVTKLVNGEIPESTLTNDLTHNQQGLPCIMGAYVIMEELARYYGLLSKILDNQSRITLNVENALNIPGQNGTLQIGTNEQYSICQDAAIKAVKWGDYLVITNSQL